MYYNPNFWCNLYKRTEWGVVRCRGVASKGARWKGERKRVCGLAEVIRSGKAVGDQHSRSLAASLCLSYVFRCLPLPPLACTTYDVLHTTVGSRGSLPARSEQICNYGSHYRPSLLSGSCLLARLCEYSSPKRTRSREMEDDSDHNIKDGSGRDAPSIQRNVPLLLVTAYPLS